MRNLRKVLPVLLCLLLVASAISVPAMAYASEAPPPTVDPDTAPEAPADTGMSEATFALGKMLMDGIWSMFGIYVPGFSFTFGALWSGVFAAMVSLQVIRMIFGFAGGPHGDAPRTSSTDNPKISKERRNDEF